MRNKTLEEVKASLKLTSLKDRERYLKRFKSDLADILELKASGVTQVWEYSDYCEDIDVNIEKRKAVIASCEQNIEYINNIMREA
jgi:Asp-tRNA(Asn)/Glu-tRNA(Gln) amidotransferase C subunit